MSESSSPHTCHVSVLPEEVVEWLAPQAGQTIVDGTLGGGGHTRLLAERVGQKAGGRVLGIDRDFEALQRTGAALEGLPVTLLHGNFSDLRAILHEEGIEQVDAILLDLGLSSDQLADRERGFSFDLDGPLDLRFDPDEGEPAWRLIHRLSERHLADLIYAYGEERYSRRIARKIVEVRRESPIKTSGELAELVRRCIPRPKQKGYRREKPIHPATRTFQALRIAVNDELQALETALKTFPDCLRPGGRLGIISFHSLEDRRVKHGFREDPRLEVLTRKPIRPTEAEIERNPRSRSSRFRVAVKTEP